MVFSQRFLVPRDYFWPIGNFDTPGEVADRPAGLPSAWWLLPAGAQIPARSPQRRLALDARRLSPGVLSICRYCPFLDVQMSASEAHAPVLPSFKARVALRICARKAGLGLGNESPGSDEPGSGWRRALALGGRTPCDRSGQLAAVFHRSDRSVANRSVFAGLPARRARPLASPIWTSAFSRPRLLPLNRNCKLCQQWACPQGRSRRTIRTGWFRLVGNLRLPCVLVNDVSHRAHQCVWAFRAAACRRAIVLDDIGLRQRMATDLAVAIEGRLRARCFA